MKNSCWRLGGPRPSPGQGRSIVSSARVVLGFPVRIGLPFINETLGWMWVVGRVLGRSNKPRRHSDPSNELNAFCFIALRSQSYASAIRERSHCSGSSRQSGANKAVTICCMWLWRHKWELGSILDPVSWLTSRSSPSSQCSDGIETKILVCVSYFVERNDPKLHWSVSLHLHLLLLRFHVRRKQCHKPCAWAVSPSHRCCCCYLGKTQSKSSAH